MPPVTHKLIASVFGKSKRYLTYYLTLVTDWSLCLNSRSVCVKGCCKLVFNVLWNQLLKYLCTLMISQILHDEIVLSMHDCRSKLWRSSKLSGIYIPFLLELFWNAAKLFFNKNVYFRTFLTSRARTNRIILFSFDYQVITFQE